MSTIPTTEPAISEVIEFIKTKLMESEKTLKAREEMESEWRTGTDKSWRAVGCFMSKAERLKTSIRHGRIAVRNRREVELLKATLRRLSTLDMIYGGNHSK